MGLSHDTHIQPDKDIGNAATLKPKGIHYIDVGTNGGLWEWERGYCVIIGTYDAGVQRCKAIFAALAPAIEEASRTPGCEKIGGTAENGYLQWDAGHFAKMVHNGLECQIKASCAEGLNIMHHANVGEQRSPLDAETSPLRDPEHYAYELNLADIAEVWRHGSLISSWLLNQAAASLLQNADRVKFEKVSDSGEGWWTIKATIDESIPAPVLSAALYECFRSRGEGGFADKFLSVRRSLFGGHKEMTPASEDGA